MSKIVEKRGKIQKQPTPQNNIAFSFRFFTDNKDFSTTGMKAGDKGEILEELIAKLRELSGMTYTDALLLPKGRGAETIPQSELAETLQNICKECPVLGENEKVIVFRFNRQKCRMICTNDATDKNVLYIIALDLHFNAYDHG